MPPSPPETRASLILRLKDPADVAAWDEVAAVYGPLVLRMAKRQGCQAADADDVVQEVFAAVAKSVSQWVDQPKRGRFRHWLLGIARNIAINVLTRRPHGSVGRGGDGVIDTLTEVPAPSGALSSQFDLEYQREVYRWAAEQVRESVAGVTWDAFYVTHMEGVAIAEAAKQLGISVGNVYIARSRVMSRLRDLAKQFEVTE
ncbi:MAG: sigma-70 family RNA polymerase sigma factor [Planctomycetales bacterium]|nr:sigma-70 family RNA polymerase sigma factor [Planctomycetales bacterium]